MGQITFSTTFADGTTPTGLEVSENTYDPLGGDNSLETFNGNVELTNFDAGVDMLRRHFQRGTWTGGKMVGATANLDYSVDLFQSFDADPDQGSEDNNYFQPIPGASMRFYLPFSPGFTLFTWSIAIANDGNGAAEQGVLKFFVDGTAIEHTRRHMGPAIFSTTRYGGERDRLYSGSDLRAGLAAGWHNVSLRIAHDFARDVAPAMRGGGLCRVRCRSLNYVYFR